MALDPDRELSAGTVELLKTWAGCLESGQQVVSEENLVLFASGMLDAEETERVLSRLLESEEMREQLIEVSRSMREATIPASSRSEAVGIVGRIRSALDKILLTPTALHQGLPVAKSLNTGFYLRLQAQARMPQMASVRDSNVGAGVRTLGVPAGSRLELEQIDGQLLRAKAHFASDQLENLTVWLDLANGVPITDSTVSQGLANFECPMERHLVVPRAIGPNAFALRLGSIEPEVQSQSSIPVHIAPDEACFFDLISIHRGDDGFEIELQAPTGILSRFRGRSFELTIPLGSTPIRLGRWDLSEFDSGHIVVSVGLPTTSDETLLTSMLCGNIPLS